MVEKRKILWGELDDSTLDIMELYGKFQRTQSEFTEAAETLNLVLRHLQKKYGDDHSKTLTCRRELGEVARIRVLKQQGRMHMRQVENDVRDIVSRREKLVEAEKTKIGDKVHADKKFVSLFLELL